MMIGRRKIIEGELSISRPSGGDGEQRIEIRFVDRASRTTFATAVLSLEQFSLAVTGLYLADVKMEIDSLALVGRKKLTRTEFVSTSGDFRNDDALKLELCKPVMKRLRKETGLHWKPYLSDLGNFHKAKKVEDQSGYMVIFSAHEKRKEEEEE